MTILRALWYYLWIAPHILQVFVLYVMARRGLFRQFPAFGLYTAVEIVQCCVLLYFLRHPRGPEYFNLYAWGLAISAAARCFVVYELFVHFFRRYPAVEKSGGMLFRIATGALLLLGVGFAVLAPTRVADLLRSATYTVDRTTSILQCGLLISLFLFSRYFALAWRSPAFGIALGMGVFSAVELGSSAIWLHLASLGAYRNVSVNIITMAVYHGCVVLWLFYLARREKVIASSETLLQQNDLEIWNRELGRLLQP
jgi:hypothetical protein